jgi:hypothetical protein
MNHFDDDDERDAEFDEDEDSSEEGLIWQLVRLINPGDEETALQQFDAWREAIEQAGAGEVDPVETMARVIDWRSGFYVDAGDPRALVQALDELCTRWNLSIDWNGDPDDDDFLLDADAASLLAIAYDRLAEHGYTVWTWETDGDSYAGWITLTRDNEPLRELATALHINLRLGNEVS